MKTFKVSTVLPNESIFFQSLHDLKKYTGSKIVGYRGAGTQKLGNLEWAANNGAHTAQLGSIPDCDLHGSWRSIHIISDDIMKALPRLVAEEILGLLRDATRTERQIALAEMYR